MKKKFLAFAASVIAVIVGVCGLSGCTLIPRTFEKEGMSITLTLSFTEKSVEGQTAYYESNSAAAVALKEPFSLLDGILSVNDYTNKVLLVNKINAEKHEREGKEYIYFTYERSVEGNSFYYLATTHKADDAFWLIQFFCFASQKDKYTEKFLSWADTVTFTSSGTTD